MVTSLKLKKRLGQHIMVSRKWLSVMSDQLEIRSTDRIMELGAGTGNLSEEILRRNPEKLTLVERDPDMLWILRTKFSSDPRVEVLGKDIREVLPITGYEKVAANPPYYLSSTIFIGLARSNFERAVMTFQREFAGRLVAKPGSHEYGSLSVIASLLFHVRLIAVVGRSAFTPRPKVESAIVVMEPKRVPPSLREMVLKYSRIIFARRKRILRNVLKPVVGEEALNVPHADKRPYHLSPEEIMEVILWLRERESE